jgi:hypothetical protein
MRAPILSDGATWLYFGNYPKRAGLNDLATFLFNRDGFDIYGPAIMATQAGVWHCLRVEGSEEYVRQSISHLTLGQHAVVPSSCRNTHHDVIAKDLADITMLRMVL